MTTPNLSLPYIAAAQAQKHVTHNAALDLLDGLVQLSVKDRDLTAPPASPAEGDRYIVAAGATGAWAGWDGDVALFSGGAWLRLSPQTGWRVWIEDEAVLQVFDGATWIGVTPDALQDLTRLGLGTTADAANPFSAKLNGALWTALAAAEGGNGDLRLTLNKENAAGVLSFLLQSGFSGRTELGLIGSDNLTLKVSRAGFIQYARAICAETSVAVSLKSSCLALVCRFRLHVIHFRELGAPEWPHTDWKGTYLMARRLVTFLGTGPKNGGYSELNYDFGGRGKPVRTRFVARALATLLECDDVVVLATEAAWSRYGAELTDNLPRAGVKLRRVAIPDGKTEAELRQQFRATHQALEGLEGADGLVFDITHGFRAQPLFATTALTVMQAAGDLPRDLQLVYGAMEATDPTTGLTPIWDLSPFFLQMDLAQGMGTFRHSGHAGALVAALERERDRLARRKLAGERPDYDLSRGLVSAIKDWSGDLDTLRLPNLASLGGKEGSAARLGRALKEYGERCRRDHPALLPLLDDLAGMAGDLAANTLFGKEGHAFHRALAKLYLAFNRPLEAAAVLREGVVSLHAAGPEGTDAGLDTFDEGARRKAEGRARRALHDSGIANLRNDLLHAGMRRGPDPAQTLTRNVKNKLDRFAEMAPQRPEKGTPGRVLFVSRHPGALEWARRRGLNAQAVAHLDVEDIRPGDTVIGTLPIHLVAEITARRARYLHLVVDLPPEARGTELSADDLDRFGARLEAYSARREDSPAADG